MVEGPIRKIAFYGTLIKDEMPKALIKGHMFDYGPYPGVILDAKEGYEIVVGIEELKDEHRLRFLDFYEGVPDLYTRETIEIKGEKHFIYIPSKELQKMNKKLILNANNKPVSWAEYQDYENKEHFTVPS